MYALQPADQVKGNASMAEKSVLIAALVSLLASAVAVAQMPNVLSGRSGTRNAAQDRYGPILPSALRCLRELRPFNRVWQRTQGMSQVIGAAGSYNLQGARGCICEEAESKNIDNRKKATETYFDMRNINEAYQAAHREPRLSKEQYARMAAQDAHETVELKLNSIRLPARSAGPICSWRRNMIPIARAWIRSFRNGQRPSGGNASKIYRSNPRLLQANDATTADPRQRCSGPAHVTHSCMG